jgi:hypothetical protein
MAEEEKKLSPVTLAAGALASVLSMFIGSLLGDAGTLIGAAVGSVTYSAGAFVVEDRTRKAHAKLKARKSTDKAAEEPRKHHIQAEMAQHPLARRGLDHAKAQQELQHTWHPRKRVAMAAGMLGLCLFAAATTLVTVESATGRTLSSNLGGPPQYGTTIGGYSTRKPSPAPVTPSPVPSSVIPSAGSPAPSGVLPDPSPDGTPDQSPSQSYTGVSSGQG